MSRKRGPPSTDSPHAKRHLNAALAAELQSLRISRGPSRASPAPRNAFGAAFSPSPFLSPPAARQAEPTFAPPPVGFGKDFEHSLNEVSHVDGAGDANPVVSSPHSSSSSASMVVDDYAPMPSRSTVYQSASQDLIIEEYDDEELPEENRLVVYRPPVRSSVESLARLNSRLPDGKFVLRNPRTDEWILAETQAERMKRKLALVPWEGDAKRKLRETVFAPPSGAIPMPWHDTDKPAADSHQHMDIEEIEEIS